MARALLLLGICAAARAADNGLALLPPMGWRSWNCFHADISQPQIMAQIDALALSRPLPNGSVTSLLALGFDSVGIDEGYEGCGLGVNGTVHYADGTPTIDPKRFPNMSALVQYAHAAGVKIGLYLNGCGCNERVERAINYAGDVALTVALGFDSVKIDSCGAQKNMTLYGALFNASGRAVQVENCHQGQNFTDGGNPGQMGAGWCPYNTYRTSGDIVNLWDRVVSNLLTVVPQLNDSAATTTTRPGCWAYADMLEVGRMAEHDAAESRSHLAAWAIVSSPLVLGFDLADAAQMAAAWPLISNEEVLAVSQAWVADAPWPSGRLVRSWQAAQVPTVAARGGCGSAAGACVDTNPKCAEWARDNQCIVNPGFMSANCQKSCGTCVGGNFSGWSFDAATGAVREAGSGLCLDSAGQLPNAGVENVLHMRECVAGEATQRWTFTNASGGGDGGGDGGGVSGGASGGGAAEGQLRSAAASNQCLRADKDWLWSYTPVVHVGGCDTGAGAAWTLHPNGTLQNARVGCVAVSTRFGPPSTVWTKPLPGGRVAVLAINGADQPTPVVLDFGTLGSLGRPARAQLAVSGAPPAQWAVRDLWQRLDLGVLSSLARVLPAHDCVMLVLSPD